MRISVDWEPSINDARRLDSWRGHGRNKTSSRVGHPRKMCEDKLCRNRLRRPGVVVLVMFEPSSPQKTNSFQVTEDHPPPSGGEDGEIWVSLVVLGGKGALAPKQIARFNRYLRIGCPSEKYEILCSKRNDFASCVRSTRGRFVITWDVASGHDLEHIGEILEALKLSAKPDAVVISPYLRGGGFSHVSRFQRVLFQFVDRLLVGLTPFRLSSVSAGVRGYQGSRIRKLSCDDYGPFADLETLDRLWATGGSVSEIPGRFSGQILFLRPLSLAGCSILWLRCARGLVSFFSPLSDGTAAISLEKKEVG